MDSAEYENFRAWKYKRWAWEFLRRNPEFKKACSAAGDDPACRAQVATEFVLKRFKRHSEGYTSGSGRPLFLSSSVSSWICDGGENSRRPRVTIKAGQVLVRFDLSVTTLDREAIEAQLRHASVIIRKRQKEYLAATGKVEPAKPSARPSYLLRYLRLLDLLDGKPRMEPGRALSILNSNRTSRLLPAEALETCGHQIDAARELSVHGYKHLANRTGAPQPAKWLAAG